MIATSQTARPVRLWSSRPGPSADPAWAQNAKQFPSVPPSALSQLDAHTVGHLAYPEGKKACELWDAHQYAALCRHLHNENPSTHFISGWILTRQ